MNEMTTPPCQQKEDVTGNMEDGVIYYSMRCRESEMCDVPEKWRVARRGVDRTKTLMLHAHKLISVPKSDN